MTTKVTKDAKVNNSNLSLVENEVSKVSGRIKTKANVLNDTANVLDEEENETPKKKEVFAEVRALFGFSVFDPEELATNLAKDLASGKITYKEFSEKLSNSKKSVNKENEKLENIPFEDVCKTIQDSDLINDVSMFLGGCKDLVSLKDKLISDNSIILYHGKQSEESEKFETVSVSVKGMHKSYKDVCYLSYLDYTVTNLIRAFRNYSYYLASLKRCKRMKEEETNSVIQYKELKKKLHEKFGYMPEDFENL